MGTELMPRVVRTRTSDATIYRGFVRTKVPGFDWGSWTSLGSNPLTNSITDSVGRPTTDSPMSSTQFRGALDFHGVVTSHFGGGYQREFAQGQVVPVAPAGISTGTIAAPDGWYLDLRAGTNPSRPVVTIPELVENLVQLPRQLQQLGSLLRSPRTEIQPRNAAGQYLGVQFGWVPMIGDLNKLLDLGTYVAKRLRELDQLAQGGIRRRLKFANDTQSGTNFWRFALDGPSNFMDLHYELVVKRATWGTIRWYPSRPLPYVPGDVERINQVRRIAMGFTPEGMTYGLWKVIPWTWLLGWFTNVGKFALANSNTVPASASTGCFMSESVRHYRATSVQFTNASNVSLFWRGSYRATTKTRIVSGSLVPGFNVPFLDTFRLSILGALATQRFWR